MVINSFPQKYNVFCCLFHPQEAITNYYKNKSLNIKLLFLDFTTFSKQRVRHCERNVVKRGNPD